MTTPKQNMSYRDRATSALFATVHEASVLHHALELLRAGDNAQCIHFLEATLDPTVVRIGWASERERDVDEQTLRQRECVLKQIGGYWATHGRDYAYGDDASELPLAMRRNAAAADAVIEQLAGEEQ